MEAERSFHHEAITQPGVEPNNPKVSPMPLQAVCFLLAASVLLAGCASEENLLDSYTQKRQDAAALDASTSDDKPSSDNNDSVEPLANGNSPSAEDTETKAASTDVAVKPAAKPAMVSDQQLRDAALAGDGPAVAAAVDSGVDVNSPDENGRTALMLAAYDGHTEIVKLLLKHKAQVNRRDSMDRTALIYCASGKNPDSVKTLLAAGAKVDLMDNQESWTALMFAAAEGNREVVKILLRHGADPTKGDVDGETSLQFATSKGHTQTAELIRKALATRDK